MQSFQWLLAGAYLVQPTEDGKLVFELPSIADAPSNACLFYDGNEHALLYRNEQNGIILDYINPEVRNTLQKSTTALIIELNTEDGEVKRSYPVAVKLVEKINVQFAKGEKDDKTD
ncbi:MAG: hypothetical protein E7013_01950 [Alphaproteobacteria bacterium]|nr:hypothetical protein [Alphaproteobacteria bacterium]